MKFEVVRGVAGPCLVIDELRLAGPKPWGGGTAILSFNVDDSRIPRIAELEKRIDHLVKAIEEAPHHDDCPASTRWDQATPGYNITDMENLYCDCWKHDALCGGS